MRSEQAGCSRAAPDHFRRTLGRPASSVWQAIRGCPPLDGTAQPLWPLTGRRQPGQSCYAASGASLPPCRSWMSSVTALAHCECLGRCYTIRKYLFVVANAYCYRDGPSNPNSHLGSRAGVRPRSHNVSDACYMPKLTRPAAELAADDTAGHHTGRRQRLCRRCKLRAQAVV